MSNFDPTDPGFDVDVLREHVRHLERQVRQLSAPQEASKAVPVADEPKCPRCGDSGWVEEGDPELGGNKVPCDLCWSEETQAEEDAYVIQRMGNLLAQIAVAIRGPEPARRRWGYTDLPERVAELVAFRQAVLDPENQPSQFGTTLASQPEPTSKGVTTPKDYQAALMVLAEFARTAPGRLPSRVQDAIDFAVGKTVGLKLTAASQQRALSDAEKGVVHVAIRDSAEVVHPGRLALSDEEIRAWWASENGMEDFELCKLADFSRMVRLVEHKLGIKPPSVLASSGSKGGGE